MKKRKNGFTLVELLVVISILVIMAIVLVRTLNPIAIVNKTRDSSRKNDLNKIKVAFEEYFTDKGVYPTQEEVDSWNIKANCDKEITQIKSYLKKLPCDPNKNPYKIFIYDNKTFKAITNLENKKDNNIPPNWYDSLGEIYFCEINRSDEYNYGVSSSNILWYEEFFDNYSLDCLKTIDDGGPQQIINDVCVTSGNIQCYKGFKLPGCKTPRCCNGTACN